MSAEETPLFPEGIGTFVHATLNPPVVAGPPYVHTISHEAPQYDEHGNPIFEARPSVTVVTTLTSADPEPPPHTTVVTEGGTRWTRYPGMWPGSWLMEGHEDTCDPETWTKVAGNYGPVTVLE